MTKTNFSHGSIFVLGSLGAGLLNYLFQVAAARLLVPDEFAALNAWMSHVALFAVTASLLQFAANFHPSRREFLRTTIVVLNIVAFLLIAAWFWQDGLTAGRALAAVIVASMVGWLLGQVQIRLAFVVMTLGGLAQGAGRFVSPFLPFADAGLERFAFAVFLGYLPALWVLSFMLWRSRSPEKPVQPSWTAPMILSLASVGLPQLDMLLMNHTQTPLVFESFVKASLFYKSIYFWVYIGAQWLLPHQIQGGARSTVRGLTLIFTVALIGCLGLTAASPLISTYVLKWAEPPAMSLVFWSCVHMSLLTMLFLWIQEMCAHRRPQLAAVVLAVLALEGATQWLLRFPASTYLYIVVCLQFLTLGAAYFLSGHLGAKRLGISA